MMASSSESHGTHDLNIALDEARAKEKSAVALPDELGVVAWDRLRELIGEYFDLGYAEGVVQRTADTMADDAQRTLAEIEAIISQAHSTIAALRAERDGIERERVRLWNEVRSLKSDLMVEKSATDTMRMERDALKKERADALVEESVEDKVHAIQQASLISTFNDGMNGHRIAPTLENATALLQWANGHMFRLAWAGAKTKARAEIAEAEVKRLTEENEALRAALGDMRCPRPCNHRPDEFDAKDCVAAGECGCGAHILAQASSGSKE